MATPPSHSREHNQESAELLQDLLGDQLPDQSSPFRPAQLRTVAEERRVALGRFLLRTWFDHALTHAERLLTVAMLAVFGYWVFDGYGRDAWHQFQQRNNPPSAYAEELPLPTPTAALTATTEPAALPFTTPDMEALGAPAPSADFLAPNSQPSRPVASDPRPQRLIIKAIGLDTPVSEVFIVDGAWQVADYAAGYHNGSALPGENGNTVMAGHAGLRGAVFRDLPALRVGDEIVIETQAWSYRYRVRETKNVWPTDVDVMNPTPTPVLTLITCTAWDTQRLIVVADLVDSRPLS